MKTFFGIDKSMKRRHAACSRLWAVFDVKKAVVRPRFPATLYGGSTVRTGRELATYRPYANAIQPALIAICGICGPLREGQCAYAHKLVSQLGARERLAQNGRSAQLVAFRNVTVVE